jgi:hypothetical protein
LHLAAQSAYAGKQRIALVAGEIEGIFGLGIERLCVVPIVQVSKLFRAGKELSGFVR